MARISIKQRNIQSTFVSVRQMNSPQYKLKQAKLVAKNEIKRLWREYRQSRLELRKAKLDYKISNMKGFK